MPVLKLQFERDFSITVHPAPLADMPNKF